MLGRISGGLGMKRAAHSKNKSMAAWTATFTHRRAELFACGSVLAMCLGAPEWLVVVLIIACWIEIVHSVARLLRPRQRPVDQAAINPPKGEHASRQAHERVDVREAS
jgi:hypothetical protein